MNFAWSSSPPILPPNLRHSAQTFQKINLNLFSPISPIEKEKEIRYSNKNYSTEEERQKFFDKIKQKQKTELCKNFSLYQTCPHKDNCSFAHGEKELRNSNISFLGYKTKICKLFNEEKCCIFGLRCNYIHRVKEKRYFSYQYIISKLSNDLYKELMKYENLNKEPWFVYRVLLSKKQIIM